MQSRGTRVVFKFRELLVKIFQCIKLQLILKERWVGRNWCQQIDSWNRINKRRFVFVRSGRERRTLYWHSATNEWNPLISDRKNMQNGHKRGRKDANCKSNGQRMQQNEYVSPSLNSLLFLLMMMMMTSSFSIVGVATYLPIKLGISRDEAPTNRTTIHRVLYVVVIPVIHYQNNKTLPQRTLITHMTRMGWALNLFARSYW